ncbi:hypothetical protein [Rufibacter quisquiliarum]|uniref:Uncharacterized protein n=1 Tax=Rufibacter quisquiliarum TaxID=1549639 RepID=A0A839GKL2_9BACT|nr:hypothetical protein [Rufibacter quisquiliarum]MBA9078323.1 hypothetical protein [Rufibacter quisquiliarum]
MKRIDLKDGHHLMLHFSADELPMNQNSLFQRYLMLDAGIGRTMQDVEAHDQRFYQLLKAGRMNEAMTELANRHYNFFHILEGTNWPGLAFCCLVHSVDGEPVTDYSEQGLAALKDRLSGYGLTQGSVEGLLEEVKKRKAQEMRLAFPEYFSEDAQAELLQKVKVKALARLEMLGSEEPRPDLERVVTDAEAYLLAEIMPRNFDLSNPANAVSQHEKAFGDLCASLEAAGVQAPEKLTEKQFYQRLRFHENRAKQQSRRK